MSQVAERSSRARALREALRRAEEALARGVFPVITHAKMLVRIPAIVITQIGAS